MDWPFYHYKMSLFVSNNNFVSWFIFSNISVATPVFF